MQTIKTTAVSTTESEYIALGECGQKFKFICMLLEEIGIRQFLPGTTHKDNEGALLSAKNEQIGLRMKYIDIQYHFIRDLVSGKFLDLHYMMSEDNYAEIMTENDSNKAHEHLFECGIQDKYINVRRGDIR